MRSLALAVVAAACGSSHGGGPDAPPADSSEVPSGTHLVDHPAVVGGITSDGYVAYYDENADGHTVAEVIPLAGGAAMPIATSTGSGKLDIKFETIGPLVLAWTDRGNRMATLTMWSAAAGAIAIGADVRPNRAGGSTDGTAVLYESAVTATTANVTAGSLASTQLVGSANAADNDCWQDTDLAASAGRLVARYCPGASTSFSLVSVAADGSSPVTLSTDASSAYYGSAAIVWTESSGALDVGTPDGSSTRALAGDASAFAVASDESTVAWLTTGGAIYLQAVAGSGSAQLVVASGAMQLGALSPDDQTVMYATQVVAMGSGYIQPYTDVLVARPGVAPLVLEPDPTSCAGCMYNSFTPDGAYALALDPIDNSDTADGAGPVRAFATSDGSSVFTFGSAVYAAVAVRGSSVIVLDAARNSALESGWAYGITLRGPQPDDAGTVIARGAESFVFDPALTMAAVSFAGSDATAGIWVTPLQVVGQP
jgi:hypothetical protein